MNRFIISIFALIISANVAAQQVRHMSVQQAIDFAMENNYDIINAGKDITAAKYKVKETTAIGLPQINASVGYNDNIARPVMIIPDFTDPSKTMELQFGTKYDANLGGSISQLLFSGEYIVGLQAAKKFLEKTNTDFFKNKVAVKQQVANSYYAALSAAEGLRIVDSTLSITSNLANETREVFNVGLAEETDVDQLDLIVSDLDASALYLQNQLIISHAFLKFYLGLNNADSLVLTDNMNSIIETRHSSELLANPFNVNQNVDFKSLINQKELGWLQVRREKAAFLPFLSANLNYQTQAQRDEWTFFNDGNWYSSSALGVKLQIPIFSSGERRAKVKQAQIAYDQIGVMEKQLKSQLNIQYNAAKNEYINAYRVYENKQLSRKTAEKIYNKTTQKYIEGMATSLDILNTHNQFLTTENEYINAALAVLKAGEELERILTKF